MSNPDLQLDLKWLIDRQAIHDQLCRYARSLDRLDALLLESVFWPDARVDLGAGLYRGTASDFVAFAIRFQAEMKVTRHEITNVLVERRGEGRAVVESYVQAFHVLEQDRRAIDLLVYGRYLDVFEQRGAEWRIAARTELIDWAHERTATADWFERQPPLNRGVHGPADGVYGLLRR